MHWSPGRLKGIRLTRGAAGAIAIASVAIPAIPLAAQSLAHAQDRKPGHHPQNGQGRQHPTQGQKGGGQGNAQSGPIGGSKHGPSARLSRQPIGASGAWRNYVLDSTGPYVYPAGVEVQAPGATSASIDNPTGLSGIGGSVTSIHSIGPENPNLVIDLGRLTGGQIEIGVSASSGVPIQVSYSEARRFLGPGGDVDHGSQGQNDDPSSRVDQFTGTGAITLPGIRGAERYIQIGLAGAGDVQIDYVRLRVTHFRPRANDYVGHFLSSDELLNRIWYAGAYTLNVSTYGDPYRRNRTVMADAGKHDRVVWLGDLATEVLTGSYTVRQMPLFLRRSLQLFTCQQERGGYIPHASEVYVKCPHPGPANGPPASAKKICTCLTAQRLPSYTAWFLIDVAYYYRMTADPRVAEWLPVIQRALRFFQKGVGPRGLFVTQAEELNWHPPDVAGGEDADTNAVWVRALQSAATLEMQLGDRRLGRRYLRASRRLAGAIRANLFDPAVGALRLNTFDVTGNHTQDANVQGVLAGVLGGTAATSALNFLRGPLGTPFGTATGQFDNDPFMGRYISPFQSGWELMARFQYFQTGEALGLMRSEWGQMVKGDPGTFWEKLTTAGGVAAYQSANPDGSPIVEIPGSGLAHGSGESSLAHGWSTAPTAMLSAYVLGMRPAGAGWKSWLVEPQPGDLKFAQGSVGTPEGKLEVRWEHHSERPSFRITVKAPHGPTGTVAVPLFGRKRTIARDGRVVWTHGHPVGGARGHRAGNYVRLFEPQPGVHTYAWAVGK
jgi:alpha-L-rhamnosidase